MRVTTEIVTRKEEKCCFDFMKYIKRDVVVKNEVKKRLNIIMLGRREEKEDKTDYLTSRSRWRDSEMEKVKIQTDKKRCQSLPVTPKPTGKVIQINKSSKLVIPKVIPKSCRKSSHSLDIKESPFLKQLSYLAKYSQQTQSKSTGTSKQPLNSFRKIQDPLPISQHLHSSIQSVNSIVTPKRTPTRITQLNYKDIKQSLYYQVQSQHCSSNKKLQSLMLLSKIPSSQLPWQFAISRQPSLQFLQYNPQSLPNSRHSKDFTKKLRIN